jgi:hypothetical protein
MHPCIVATFSFEVRNGRANSLKRAGLSLLIPTRAYHFACKFPCEYSFSKLASADLRASIALCGTFKNRVNRLSCLPPTEKKHRRNQP